MNAAQAAIRAGYKGDGAKQAGYALLQRQDVAAAVVEAKANSLVSIGVERDRVLQEVARVALTDRRGMWRNGQLKPFDEWTPDEAALLEGFEVIVKNARAGDGHQDTVHKVTLAKKLPALELLCNYLGLTEADLGPAVQVPCFIFPPGTQIAVK